MQKLKILIVVLAVGLTLSASVSFASWATNTWRQPDSWVAGSRGVSAQNIGESFEYLLRLRGSACSTHNDGRLRLSAGTLEYCKNGSWVGSPNQTSLAVPPTNGVWSGWGNWSYCNASCGSGTMTRYRTCTEPAPANGGVSCAGSTVSTTSCNTHACYVETAGGSPVVGGGSGR